MNLRHEFTEGLKEAGRQLLGLRKRRRFYKYTLTLSEPLPTTHILKELQKTELYKHLLNVEQMPLNKYWYDGKYKVIHPTKSRK